MRPIPVTIPYCGLPPHPGELWSRWNLDPLLIAILILAAALYAGASIPAARHGAIGRRNVVAFFAGWLILTLALISPLCALSVSLFAARVGQHMLIVLAAVPLIAAGRPAEAARAVVTRRPATATSSGTVNAVAASAAFAITLWSWHMPQPYAATFRGDAIYWAMHVTMIASALWLWTVLLDRRHTRAVTAIAAGLAASTQMSLLGAAITFASHPLYAPHELTTASWGMTQMVDQQLGGAIMWVPGGAAFLIAAMTILISLLAADRPVAALDMKPR